MRITFYITLSFFALISCANHPTRKEDKINSFVEQGNRGPVITYPFELSELEGIYTVSAFITSEELYPKYYNFFEKYGYEGNGSCWAGHIEQMLEKLDPALLEHLEFDAESEAFFATADSKEVQLRFVEILSPIFSDLEELGKWVLKSDRSRIFD